VQSIHNQVPELHKTRFAVFPNALSEDWVSAAAQGLAGIEPKMNAARYILSVTRLDRNERYKGLVTTIEAFAMLDDQSLRYVIAGSGDDLAFLESVAARLGVGDRVHFVGAVPDSELVRLYQNCVAFVLPSGKEGFGIVYLEAMFFGAPVIAAAARGAVDVVLHEQTGLLVAYGDVVGLRTSLQRLLSDEKLRERILVGGNKTVTGKGRFTFEAYTRRLSKILHVPRCHDPAVYSDRGM
jgi:glycosyltransferase involved in cell wall biosynthesis